MSRKWLLALLALLFITPALAQVMQVQKLDRPVIVRPLPAPSQDLGVQPNSDIGEKLMTIEEAQAQIARLREERRELNARLSEAVATIEQMTKAGGSLVRAYCESESVSRNTAGASETCNRYKCGEVDGLCKKSCTSSNDCLGETRCADGQCLTLGELQQRS